MVSLADQMESEISVRHRSGDVKQTFRYIGLEIGILDTNLDKVNEGKHCQSTKSYEEKNKSPAYYNE